MPRGTDHRELTWLLGVYRAGNHGVPPGRLSHLLSWQLDYDFARKSQGWATWDIWDMVSSGTEGHPGGGAP